MWGGVFSGNAESGYRYFSVNGDNVRPLEHIPLTDEFADFAHPILGASWDDTHSEKMQDSIFWQTRSVYP